jgi:hypothetical protein
LESVIGHPLSASVLQVPVVSWSLSPSANRLAGCPRGAVLKGMNPKKITHKELLAKIDEIGDSALAELRRRGVSEAKIKGMLARRKPKQRQKPNG